MAAVGQSVSSMHPLGIIVEYAILHGYPQLASVAMQAAMSEGHQLLDSPVMPHLQSSMFMVSALASLEEEPPNFASAHEALLHAFPGSTSVALNTLLRKLSTFSTQGYTESARQIVRAEMRNFLEPIIEQFRPSLLERMLRNASPNILAPPAAAQVQAPQGSWSLLQNGNQRGIAEKLRSDVSCAVGKHEEGLMKGDSDASAVPGSTTKRKNKSRKRPSPEGGLGEEDFEDVPQVDEEVVDEHGLGLGEVKRARLTGLENGGHISGDDDSLQRVLKRRRKFTEQEIANLLDGVARFGKGNWRAILDTYEFLDRSTVDLKDKWRNLEKSNDERCPEALRLSEEALKHVRETGEFPDRPPQQRVGRSKTDDSGEPLPEGHPDGDVPVETNDHPMVEDPNVDVSQAIDASAQPSADAVDHQC
eukprot:ANDGO_00359.mRNA.1 hypothetical protein